MPEQPSTMQPTSSTADDVFLEAKARFEQWQQEFESEWYKPQAETAAKMLWNSQPNQVKDYIRQKKPRAAKEMDELTRKDG